MRDGRLSSIHQYLVQHPARMVEVLGVESKTALSRAQLSRVLGQVAVGVLDELLLAHGRVILQAEEKKWFALNSKSLKGSRVRVND